MIYDQVEGMKEDDLNIPRLEAAWAGQENVAFIISGKPREENAQVNPHVSGQALVITQETSGFRILGYNVNSIRLQTNFPTQKFLVYNDNYHSGWQAFIDGREVKLYRANGMAKGVWVPAGEHTIMFRFGKVGQYILGYGLMTLFQFIFWWMIVLMVKSRRLGECDYS